MLLRAAFASALMLASLRPGGALANDTTAELGAGGLVMSRTDAVVMQSEDLFISAKEVRVDYVFRNQTETDVNAVVAFPLPDLGGNPYENVALPDMAADNFLDFAVTVDGKQIKPTLDQHAMAAGVDVTEDLRRAGVPLYPFSDAAVPALAALSPATSADWIDRGLIIPDTYDDGSGWKTVRTPFWSLRSAYWWRSRFPAGKNVSVSHRYKPSVGGSVGLAFSAADGKLDESFTEYRHRFCIDDAFERTIRKAVPSGPDGAPPYNETRIRYVLTTGGNWALGTIGRFHLTVDKGDPKALVSFCADGVKKTGPTTFEAIAQDFSPQRDLDILILLPAEQGGGEAEPVRAAQP